MWCLGASLKADCRPIRAADRLPPSTLVWTRQCLPRQLQAPQRPSSFLAAIPVAGCAAYQVACRSITPWPCPMAEDQGYATNKAARGHPGQLL